MKHFYYSLLLCGLMSMPSAAQMNVFKDLHSDRNLLQTTPEKHVLPQIMPGKLVLLSAKMMKPDTTFQRTSPRLMSLDEVPRPLSLSVDTMVVTKKNVYKNGELTEWEEYSYDQYGLPKEIKAFKDGIYQRGTSHKFIVDHRNYWVSLESFEEDEAGNKSPIYKQTRDIDAYGRLVGLKEYEYDSYTSDWSLPSERRFDYEHVDLYKGRGVEVYRKDPYHESFELEWFAPSQRYEEKYRSYSFGDYLKESISEFKSDSIITKSYENGRLTSESIIFYDSYDHVKTGQLVVSYREDGSINSISGNRTIVERDVPEKGYVIYTGNEYDVLQGWVPTARRIDKDFDNFYTPTPGLTFSRKYEYYDKQTNTWKFNGEGHYEWAAGNLLKKNWTEDANQKGTVEYALYDDNLYYVGSKYDRTDSDGYVMEKSDKDSVTYRYYSADGALEHYFVIRNAPLSEHFNISYPKVYEKVGDDFRYLPSMDIELQLPGAKITHQYRTNVDGFPLQQKTIYALDTINQGKPFVLRQTDYARPLGGIACEKYYYSWPESNQTESVYKHQSVSLKTSVDGTMNYSNCLYGQQGEVLSGSNIKVDPTFMSVTSNYINGKFVASSPEPFNSYYKEEDGTEIALFRTMTSEGVVENDLLQKVYNYGKTYEYGYLEHWKWSKELKRWMPSQKHVQSISSSDFVVKEPAEPLCFRDSNSNGHLYDSNPYLIVGRGTSPVYIYKANNYRFFAYYYGNDNGDWEINNQYWFDVVRDGNAWKYYQGVDHDLDGYLYVDENLLLQKRIEFLGSSNRETLYSYAFDNYLSSKIVRDKDEAGNLIQESKTEYIYETIKMQPTSIEEMEGEPTISVNGTAIQGADGVQMAVYDMSGRLIATGQHRVNVPSKGIYVVKCGTACQKVVVR